MTQAEILQAIGQRLQGMANCPPIVWPNKVATLPRPYLVVQIIRGGASDPTLAGAGNLLLTGQFMVTVVADLNAFSTAADALADQIAARFPKGLRPAPRVVITAPAEILNGYPDEVSWRVPVRVRYLAT